MGRMLLVAAVLVPPLVQAQTKQTPGQGDDSEKPRVFITDSTSWEVGGQSGGFGGAGASKYGGGARPQTAEIVKTFGERCPQVVTNNIQTRADYIVVLDHEGGKGMLRHKNKVAVFTRVTGDSVISKSTLSLGGSVQEACNGINEHWSVHAAEIRSASQTATPTGSTPAPVVVVPAATKASTGRVAVTSIPDGSDIEIDGSFAGNAPSDIELTAGEHTVLVKKAGFRDWERKLKIAAGSTVRLNAEMEKAP